LGHISHLYRGGTNQTKKERGKGTQPGGATAKTGGVADGRHGRAALRGEVEGRRHQEESRRERVLRRSNRPPAKGGKRARRGVSETQVSAHRDGPNTKKPY